MFIFSKSSPTYEEDCVIDCSSTKLQNESTLKSATMTHWIQAEIKTTTN